MANKFTCSCCFKTFDKQRSNAEAMKEYKSSPWYVKEDKNPQVICDDCFIEFKKWFSKLTPEEHEMILKNKV